MRKFILAIKRTFCYSSGPTNRIGGGLLWSNIKPWPMVPVCLVACIPVLYLLAINTIGRCAC